MSGVERVVVRGGVVGDATGQMPVPPDALLPVPAPEHLAGGAVSIREAVPGDTGFIDALQKANNKAVGFMPHAQLAGHIEQGHVLVAEAMKGSKVWGLGSSQETTPGQINDSALDPRPQTLDPTPVGYCIGVDKYFKREDTGVIYQMNVVPGRRRGLVGAALLRAMLERSAYGVKLFCCWCAQDLEANRFWEAMGFVPIAFRTGSRKKSWVGADGVRRRGPRIHIFWQKPVRASDAAAAERERAVKRLSVEGGGQEAEQAAKQEQQRRRAAKRAEQAAEAARASSVGAGGLRFGAPASASGADREAQRAAKAARKRAEAEVSKKNDPELVAMARELRDRWLDAVAGPGAGLPAGESGAAGRGLRLEARGKYAVGRCLGVGSGHEVDARVIEVVEVKRLDAA